MLEIGSIIDGKYKILNKIGQGGMSVVYLAMNERANKQWAIKEVRKDGVKDYEVVRQGLIAETDILKRLNHPNLPSIIDVIDRDDTFLIVMDYIEGKNLDYRLKKKGAQPQERVVDWAMQICDVLGYLHSRKPPIIYRDLKPANIMLRPDGRIEIIDFGTAREFKESSVEDTSCLGTQGYAAPEQYGGHGQTDARTDIYTLGATMYHLLTGHNPSLPPYEMYPIRQWDPNLSSGLEQIILKCTQRDPSRRYQNCAELMYALQHYTELDSTYRKKQKRKMNLFAASVAAAVISIGACIGLNVAANRTSTDYYQKYLDQAEKEVSADTDAAYEDYLKATTYNQGKADAYESMFEAYYSDYSLTGDEYQDLTSLLSANGNEEAFEKSSYEEYVEFCRQFGIALYFTDDFEQGKEYSEYYLKKVSEAAEEDEDIIEVIGSARVELVERLLRIEQNESKLSGQNTDQIDSESYDYASFWSDLTGSIEDLDTLTNADEEDDVVSANSAVNLYRLVFDKIEEYYTALQGAGITDDAMTEVLSDASEVLTELQNGGVSNMDDSQWTQVWSSYNAAYRTVSAETGSERAQSTQGGTSDE